MESLEIFHARSVMFQDNVNVIYDLAISLLPITQACTFVRFRSSYYFSFLYILHSRVRSVLTLYYHVLNFQQKRGTREIEEGNETCTRNIREVKKN